MVEINKYELKTRRFRNWFWYIHLNADKEYSVGDLLKVAAEDGAYVKPLLYYAYTPTMYYGITPIRVKVADRPDPNNELVGKTITATYKEFIAILEDLHKQNINRKEGYDKLYALFTTADRYTRWAYNRVLARDFKLGDYRYAKLKKVFPDLFEVFPAQLITVPTSLYVEKLTFPFYITPLIYMKRALIVSTDDSFEIMKPLGGVRNVSTLFDSEFPINTVIDGFFYGEKRVVGSRKKYRYPKLYHEKRLLMGIKKRRKVKIYKLYPKYIAIDYIPLFDFYGGGCKIPFTERYAMLKQLSIWNDDVKLADNFVVNNLEDLYKVMTKYTGRSLLMRKPDSQYSAGKNGNWKIIRPRFLYELRRYLYG